jgi:hypothetical protein
MQTDDYKKANPNSLGKLVDKRVEEEYGIRKKAIQDEGFFTTAGERNDIFREAELNAQRYEKMKELDKERDSGALKTKTINDLANQRLEAQKEFAKANQGAEYIDADTKDDIPVSNKKVESKPAVVDKKTSKKVTKQTPKSSEKPVAASQTVKENVEAPVVVGNIGEKLKNAKSDKERAAIAKQHKEDVVANVQKENEARKQNLAKSSYVKKAGDAYDVNSGKKVDASKIGRKQLTNYDQIEAVKSGVLPEMYTKNTPAVPQAKPAAKKKVNNRPNTLLSKGKDGRYEFNYKLGW